MPMSVVIRQLMASPATTVAQLYAGVVSASVASVAVGEWGCYFGDLKQHETRAVSAPVPCTSSLQVLIMASGCCMPAGLL
jgi:hypothetical protein